MWGELGSRVHAFVNGGGSRDKQRAQRLCQELKGQLRELGLLSHAPEHITRAMLPDILEDLALPTNHPQSLVISDFLQSLLETEGLFSLGGFDPVLSYSEGEYWEAVQTLNKQLRLLQKFDESCHHIRLYCSTFFHNLYQACPLLTTEIEGDVILHSSLLHFLREPGTTIETLIRTINTKEVEGLFPRTQERLEYNLIMASGGNLANPAAINKPKYPSTQNLAAQEMAQTYLQGTVLAPVLDQEVSFSLPTKKRFEHHHIVAGSGHGKTQTLQYLIAQDLLAVERGERSLVVMDSQGDLLRNISQLAQFKEGGPLAERIVIIDPSDVEFPLALNLFDVGQARLSDYSALERERLTNSILELYDFVLSSLLDASLTQKQNVIFRFVMRLLLTIPDATIHTFREIMQEGSEKEYGTYFTELEGSARHFFEVEFGGKEFAATRRQVLRRLWGILENSTFERMFSHPKSKLDLFSELNSGRVILINTAKDLLQETGTELFGRFFIALIAQAAQERATLREQDRMPTMVYIDEAADYFDQNFATILSQARKYKVGMILAHQYLGQLEPRLQEAFAANTSIKMAGGVSTKDARALAPAYHISPEYIERQKVGSFACHIRGMTDQAIPVAFPFGHLEAMPRMSVEERFVLQKKMRARYCVPYGKSSYPKADEKKEEVKAGEPTKGW